MNDEKERPGAVTVPEPDWSRGPTEDDLRALDDLDGPDPRDRDIDGNASHTVN